MKTTRYRFETALQGVTEDSTQWLMDEFKSVLESEKDYTRKCDYIGFSIASIDSKVASIDEEIQELQQLKKALKSAKDIALTVGAELFSEYGIEKLEGAGISSITITQSTTKIHQTLSIRDADALIALGYCKQVVDEDAIAQIHHNNKSEELTKVLLYSTMTTEEITTPAKLKINKRRASSINTNSISLKEVA